MNTKGIKFLAVLAVLAMAFAAVIVLTEVEDSDAADAVPSATVFSGETNEYATVTKQGSTTTYVLKGNVTLSDKWVVNLSSATDTIVVDAAKYTLIGWNQDQDSIEIKKGILTLKNGTFNSPVRIRGDNSADSQTSTLNIAADAILNAGDSKGYAVIIGETPALEYGMVLNVYGKITGMAPIWLMGNLGNTEASSKALDDATNKPTMHIYSTAVIGTESTILAIAHQGYCITTIDDGAKITAGAANSDAALGVKRGTVTINGGTFYCGNTSTIDTSALPGNASGAETTGAALSVTSTYNYAGAIKVTVNGGTFESKANDALGAYKTNLADFNNGEYVKVKGGSYVGVTSAVKLVSSNTKYSIELEGGEYNDLSALSYAKSGKTVTLAANYTNGTDIVIPEDVTLVIKKGVTLINNGTITVNGTLTNNGTIDNKDGKSITSSGTINGKGKIEGFATSDGLGIIEMTGGTITGQTINTQKNTHADSYTIRMTGAGEISGNVFELYDGQRGVAAYPGTSFKILNNEFKNMETIASKKPKTAVYIDTESGNGIQVTGVTMTGVFAYGIDFNSADASNATKVGTSSTNDIVVDTSIDYIRISAKGFTFNDSITINKKLTLNADSTIAGTMTIGPEASIGGTGKLTIDGVLVYSDLTQIYANTETGTNGTIEVAGQGGQPEEEVVIDPKDMDIEANKPVTAEMFDKVEEEVVVTTTAISGATIPEGRAIVIKDPANLKSAENTIDVSSKNSAATVVTDNSTFSVITETGKTVAVKGVTGTLTFYKGSVVVEAKDWSGGSITLDNGDVLKISGSISPTGDSVKIDVVADGKATVIVEEDAVLTLTAKTLIIDERIDVKVYGKIVGGGTIQVAKSMTINSGAVVSSEITGGSKATFTVYSGSDINDATIAAADLAKFTGKDAASGIWTYKDNDLTLENYNGTYNFGSFDGDIHKIYLSGINSISYAIPETYNGLKLFGNDNITDITTESTGSLEISVDVSKITKEKIAQELIVIDGAALKINGVSVSISVTGSNSTWLEDISKLNIIGIDATSLDLFKAPLSIAVMESVEAEGIYAVKSGGAVKASSDSDMEITGYNALKAGAVTIQASEVEFNGISDINGLTISNESTVEFNGELTAGATAITVSQNSTLGIDDATIKGAITNNGFIGISGNVVFEAAVTNNDTFDNDGTIGIFAGKFDNNGTFYNDGSFTVFAKDSKKGTAAAFGITDDDDYIAGIGSKILLKGVEITNADKPSLNADGSINVDATLTFIDKNKDTVKAADLAKDALKFDGKLTPSQTKDGNYTIELISSTAKITITYTKATTTDKHVGGEYAISVSGALEDKDGKLIYIENNQPKSGKDVAGAEITTDVMATWFTGASGSFVATKGTATNNGAFKLYAVQTGEDAGLIVDEKATFNGNITLFVAAIANGAVNGNITSTANVTADSKSIITGDIISDKNVTSKGTITGNIVSKGDVEVKNITGNITMKTPDTKLTVKGKAVGTVTYISEYKATKDATTKTEYTATLNLNTDADKSVIIAMMKGADATDTEPVIPGYFSFGVALPDDLGKDKFATITVTEGRFAVENNVTLAKGYALVIESGVMIEVSKIYSLTADKAALKVSKDAVRNYEVGPDAAKTYGKVTSIMMFDTADGYTIYSDVAYALSNCDEGAELTVNSNADISSNVSVKKGVNVIIGNKITVDFKTNGLTMADDAKITLKGTGKVLFGQTGEKTEKDKAWEFYTISGTIVYDGNIVVLDKVRFSDAGAELTGIAATASAASKISTKLNYFQGEATISAGNAAGAIVLLNKEYALADGATESLFSGELVISAGAVCDATVTDAAAKAVWNDDKNELKTTKKASLVTVNGTLNAAKDLTVKGLYVGTGKIVLSPNVTLTINGGEYLYDKTNEKQEYYGPSFTGTVVDTTDAAHEHTFLLVSAKPAAAKDVTPVDAEPLKIKALKTSAVEYITLEGAIVFGSIVADGAELNDLDVLKGASVTAEVVEILKNSTAEGSVVAKVLKQKTETETKLGELDYTATYMLGDYTVYTVFVNIDPELVSDITLTKDLTLSGEELDLSGYDINITIADGCVLKLETKTVGDVKTGSKLIIGTPATVLGEEGSSITGVVVIDGALSYIVAYADVDLDDAEIYSVYDKNDASKCKAAVYSVLDIEDVPFAAIFANEATTVKLADADKKVVPEIEGYVFTKWCNYDDDKESKIGETNAYADFKAVTVFVTVKFVTGIAYYCNGIEFAVYDTPVKVEYNSVFTAKISDTSKYQGTPLVNGKNSLVITDDIDIVGSGVTPIPVPPEPEPEPVIGDSGISLTDILLIVLVVLIAIMVVILVLRLNRS